MSGITSASVPTRPDLYNTASLAVYCTARWKDRNRSYKDGYHGRTVRRWWNREVEYARESTVIKVLGGYGATLDGYIEWATQHGVPLFKD